MITAIINAGLTPPSELIGDGKLHRFAGNGDARKKNAWYIFYDDESPAGVFGDWKTGVQESWTAKTTRSMTPEDKARHKQRIEEARRIRDAEAERVHSECREWCAKVWPTAQPAPDDHPYLTRKQIPASGARIYRDSLIIPVKDWSGTIHGVQFISPDGTKKFKTGTDKQGRFFIIGKPNGKPVIVCEGFATGASLHQATGYAVFVAFDAGNLLPVAKLIRERRPQAEIIVAADNDQWHKETLDSGEMVYHPVPCTIKGRKYENTGVVKASEVVKQINGRLVYPDFANLDTHPTDFNDLAILEGNEAVCGRLTTEPEMEEPPPLDEEPHPEIEAETAGPTLPFLCLGYDQGLYYYLPDGSQQIVSLSPQQHMKSHLMTIAPLQWWQQQYANDEGKVSWDAAANSLIQQQHRTGIYDSSRIKGRGAWWDQGKVIIHLGDHLRVSGQKVPLKGYHSRNIYERAPPLELNYLDIKPLATAEASRFIDLAELLNWEKSLSARLLIGWCVVAPICGALPWRPHIWLTGGSGTGKSWTVDNIIKPLCGNIAEYVLGTTTEAGIRQKLRTDARPVIFDEAESENQHSAQRLQAVLELARQASSEGAEILKGTAGGRVMAFRIRSAFCFSSVGVGVNQQADSSRITVLNLTTGTPEKFDRLKKLCAEIVPAHAAALRARSMSLVPKIRDNSLIFARAAAERLGSQRMGDQIGGLLAGAFSLRSVSDVPLDTAREWMACQDMEGTELHDDQRDEWRCLRTIMESKVKVNGTRVCYELTLGELVLIALGQELAGPVDQHAANDALLRHGIKTSPVDNIFMVSNTHTAIGKILAHTPWSVNWKNQLARLPGAISDKPQKFRGTTSRVVILSGDLL